MGKRGFALFCSFLQFFDRFLRDLDRRFGALVVRAGADPFFGRFFRAVGMRVAQYVFTAETQRAQREDWGKGKQQNGTAFTAEFAEACPERAERAEGTQRKMEMG